MSVADEDDDVSSPIGGVAPSPSSFSSLHALGGDFIDLEGLRLGLLITFAPAPQSSSATVIPQRAEDNSSPLRRNRPDLMQTSLVEPALKLTTVHNLRLPPVEDDFQFGLVDDGVAVFPGTVRAAAGPGRGYRPGPSTVRDTFHTSRIVPSFVVDAPVVAGFASRPTGRSHFSALLDGDNRAAPELELASTVGAIDDFGTAAAAVTQPRRKVTQRGHDWQQGPVVVSVWMPRATVASSMPQKRRRLRGHASGSTAPYGDDSDDNDDNDGARNDDCAKISAACGCFFGGLWAIGFALQRASDPVRSIDIGGHDDIVGQRIDLRLPYAGLCISSSLRWSPAERATLATFLKEPRRCCGSGRRRRHARGLSAPPVAISTRSMPGSHTGSSGQQQSDDTLPPLLQQALSVATSWTARTRRRNLPGWVLDQDEQYDDLRYEDEGSSSSGSSGNSSDDAGTRGVSPSPPADIAHVAAQRVSGTQRGRGESFQSGSTSDTNSRAQRHSRHVNPYARPTPKRLFWTGGVSLSSLCDIRACRGALCLRRLLFVTARFYKRPSLPAPQPPSARVRSWAMAAALHVSLMLAEVAVTIVLVSELWCVEPLPTSSSSSSVLITHFSDQECNMGPLVVWAALPPGACILPTLLGLGAVAVQSSRALRLYSLWNAFSLWNVGVAAALVLVFLPVLGLYVLSLPLLLFILKTASAQCVGVQLYEIESSRPIRGWRGLFEVRTGPVERTSNADVRSEYRG